MTRRAHQIATLFLLAVFVAYGLEALTIPLFPGQEQEPFKPRTMPVALALAGIVLLLIRLGQLILVPEESDGDAIAGFDWPSAGWLCAWMVLYGLALTPLGFVVATTLFLIAGFVTLGERRPLLLAALPLLFSLAFFLLMTRGLGLYLAPGLWWGS